MSIAADPTLDVTLLIPARNSGHALANTVREAHAFLNSRFAGQFEIILIPNQTPKDIRGSAQVELQDDFSLAQRLSQQYTGVKVCPHTTPIGKGAAIRTGVMASRGKWIFFTDADLPYGLAFFDKATAKLREGYDLISGNRRLDESIFNIPVSLLPIVYKRHRLGLLFNRLVRLLLPLPTSDTQAGIKAMSRKLASVHFARQTCPGFFFDLELFLTATANGYKHVELPVLLHLNTEKSTVKILRDSLLAGYWITRIAIQAWIGRYGALRSQLRRPPLLVLYKNLRFRERFFLFLRWHLTPYLKIEAELPPLGQILDIGCGHGLLALTAAHRSPGRTVFGIDHDPERITHAKGAVASYTNIQFDTRGLTDLPPGLYSGITLIDVMHYLSPAEQAALVDSVYRLLKPGGVFLMRDVDPERGVVSSWNRFYEHLVTRIGFTRSLRKELTFKTRKQWEHQLRSKRFEVKSVFCSHPLFADILYICRRPE